MATLLKSLFAAFLLCLIGQGMCQKCALEDIIIRQSQTGTQIQSMPEFKVTLLNACPCLQGQVKLSCHGFQTVQQVGTVTLAKNGNTCLLNNGSTMAPFSGAFFTYAWDTQFPFKAIYSEISCN